VNPRDELVSRVLECANRVAGTSLSLPQRGDVPLEAFEFDSLSLFAFILELERTCGIKFDETLLNHEGLASVRSTAALIEARVPLATGNSQTRRSVRPTTEEGETS
jgi:phosphopantetheine binding protein